MALSRDFLAWDYLAERIKEATPPTLLGRRNDQMHAPRAAGAIPSQDRGNAPGCTEVEGNRNLQQLPIEPHKFCPEAEPHTGGINF